VVIAGVAARVLDTEDLRAVQGILFADVQQDRPRDQLCRGEVAKAGREHESGDEDGRGREPDPAPGPPRHGFPDEVRDGE